MSDFITKLSELIDPEVMGDMVSARIPKKLRVAPFAKIDDTLQGVPGDTITVPAYTYIGDASDVAEGGEVAIEKMTTSTRKATIKKALKGLGLTDGYEVYHLDDLLRADGQWLYYGVEAENFFLIQWYPDEASAKAKLAQLEELGDGKQYLVDLDLKRTNPTEAENFGNSNPVQLRS